MKFKLSSKILFLGVIGLSGLIVGTVNVNAASFEDMKEHVEAGEGQVYNPISNEIMDEEKSLEYVQYIEEALEGSNSEEIPEEIQIEAFIETKSEESPQSNVDDMFPPILTRGTTPPTGTPRIVDDFVKPYESNPFSGSGWHFSGLRFTVRNVKLNPYFGIRAHLDSFKFFNGMHDVVAPVSNNFTYTVSNFRGTPFIGYFATWNPVTNSRYHIY
ncbi:hypothetical protein IW492_11310 [Enterococcus sp. BWB1-3]|uniref:hypothetical protein n=1 Tax=Enterococcus sp. BWB1-3 TaxID=2787713 RepID=UPI0019224C70|nr:hypothetical protein [Enterococcus sp. BWB1-3]MBL1229820.1 hypothetical protein [Enterococcus sp. BWB1-3]